MIKELCLQENFACIHAITPTGGSGKSKYNNEHIDIYERFKFNVDERKGIPTSIFRNATSYQSKFGPQGLLIYDGIINNANCTDAGSIFNDDKGIWETTEGINTPDLNHTINEIQKANGSYVELNIYNYSICGVFIDLTQLDYCKTCIRTLKEFYDNTSYYDLPYYGLSSMGIIEINREHIKNEDWIRIQEGTLVSIKDIYAKEIKTI